MKRSTGSRKGRRYAVWPPETPGVIAPKFLAMFADVKRPRRRAFLAAYVQEAGRVMKARAKAGGGWKYIKWLRDDPDFRAAFERAKRAVADAVQAKVCRRAGIEALSDARLMSMLRYLRRERYGPSTLRLRSGQAGSLR